MRHLLKISLPAAAASLVLAACGSSSSTTGSSSTGAQSTASSASSAAVVKTASSSLGTILVDSQGMTLYHLSGEQNGKFICTGACVSVWHPLTAATAGAPSGTVGSLGTVKRPEGTTQVTYKGSPLYTFTGDSQAGQTHGQGIKDVGTWTVVATSSASGQSSTTPSSSSSSEGGYKY